MNQLTVFNPVQAQIAILAKPLLAIKVTDEVTQRSATEQLRQAGLMEKEVERLRKEFVGPLNDQVKMANNYAKEMVKPLVDGVAHLKSELRAHEMKLQKIRDEQMKAAEAERVRKLEEAKVEAARNVTPPPEDDWAAMIEAPAPDVELKQAEAAAAHHAQVATIEHEHKQAQKQVEAQKVSGARKVWTYKVKEALQVPREYLVLDEVLIRGAIRNGVREIAGLEIYEDIVIARGRA